MTTSAPAKIKRKVRDEALLGRSPQDTPAGWINYIFLTVIVLIGIWPIYWAGIISSWKGEDKLFKIGAPQVIPDFSGSGFTFNLNMILGKITEPGYPAYASAAFGRSFMNSLLVVAIVVFATLFFCSLAGFAFAKLHFKGRNVLFLMVVLTLTIPAQLGIVGGYQIMATLGWVDTLLAVTVPALVSAFGVFYMRQFIEDAVPDELVESARVDGASTFRVYVSIVLPVVRSALGVLGLITAVGAWNEYQWALVVVGGSEWQTIGPALHALRAGSTPKSGIIITGSFLASLPLMVLLFVAGRQIVRGIMEGAIKA